MKSSFGGPISFSLERAAAPLFGIKVRGEMLCVLNYQICFLNLSYILQMLEITYSAATLLS